MTRNQQITYITYSCQLCASFTDKKISSIKNHIKAFGKIIYIIFLYNTTIKLIFWSVTISWYYQERNVISYIKLFLTLNKSKKLYKFIYLDFGHVPALELLVEKKDCSYYLLVLAMPKTILFPLTKIDSFMSLVVSFLIDL